MAIYNPYPYPQYQPQYQPQMQTRMVEVIPVDSVEAAGQTPVPIGSTLLMIGRDDSFICVKVNGVNGHSSFETYDKRPPAPSAPVFDPALYVTREELETRLNALKTAGKRDDE